MVRGIPSRRNVDINNQGVPNAQKEQFPQREVTNTEFRDAIRMLSQVVADQAGKQRGFF